MRVSALTVTLLKLKQPATYTPEAKKTERSSLDL